MWLHPFVCLFVPMFKIYNLLDIMNILYYYLKVFKQTFGLYVYCNIKQVNLHIIYCYVQCRNSSYTVLIAYQNMWCKLKLI